MVNHWIYLALVTFGIYVFAEDNSNFKARIDISAFKFFSKAAHHVLNMEVPKIPLPNVTHKVHEGFGEVEISAYNLKMTKFESPKFDFRLVDGSISWSSLEGAVDFEGEWEAKYTLGYPVRLSGWMKVQTAAIELNVTAKVAAVDYRPQLSVNECSATVDHLKIQTGGGVLPWLANLFHTVTSYGIKTAIRRKACHIAQSIVVAQFNDYLLSLPLHIPFEQNLYLDYAIKQDPIFTRSSVETEAKATVVYGNHQCHLEKVEKWSEVNLTQKMMVVWMDESVPNCLLRSAHEGGLLQFTATKEDPSIESYLRTSCSFFSFCVGRFFTKLQNDYNDTHVDLHFHSYKTPVVQMHNGVIKVNTTFAIDFYIHPMKENPDSLARLVLVSSSSVIPQIIGNRLTGSLSTTHEDFRFEFSHIGEISKFFLSAFVSLVSIVTNAMNKLALLKGIPLPIFDNITIAEGSEFRIFEKYIRLNADFDFK